MNSKEKSTLFTVNEMVKAAMMLREAVDLVYVVPIFRVGEPKERDHVEWRINRNQYEAIKGTPEHAAWMKYESAGLAHIDIVWDSKDNATVFQVSEKGLNLLGIMV